MKQRRCGTKREQHIQRLRHSCAHRDRIASVNVCLIFHHVQQPLGRRTSNTSAQYLQYTRTRDAFIGCHWFDIGKAETILVQVGRSYPIFMSHILRSDPQNKQVKEKRRRKRKRISCSPSFHFSFRSCLLPLVRHWES